MLNTQTMQLDLFQGLILNTEQQEQVDNFVERQAKRSITDQKNIDTIMLMLDEAGFVRGVDYDSNFQNHEVTKEREFGYSYNNTNFKYEVTYMNPVGQVYLKVNKIKDGKVQTYNSSVSREGNKLMCTCITNQYRHYKPSSLLGKFHLYNQNVLKSLENKNKENVALRSIAIKYQKLYPAAKVTIGSDYYRGGKNYIDFPIVKVEFISGSWISFRLGYGSEMDKERFHKKHDAQTESTQELLTRFNNQ